MNRIKSITFKRILAFSAMVVLAMVGTAGPVHAQGQEKEGVGISPTKFTLDANPGERLTSKFTVTNPGTSPVDFRVYVKDFRIQNEEYEKTFEPVSGGLSPVGWFKVPGGVRSLQPGAQQTLDYTIEVPKNTVPRGYYAVIFAETLPTKADGTGVARLKRVGSLVYLTVNGGTVEKGELVSFESEKWQSRHAVKAALRIKNNGNVHFTASGTVRLKDLFGRTISQTKVNGTILPATTRKFTPELKVGSLFGVYRVEGDVSFLGKTTQLDSKWVIAGSPLWLLLWVIIIVGWTVVLIRLIKRRAKNKKK